MRQDWQQKVISEKRAVIDIPIRIYFEKWGTPRYWDLFERELKAEIKEFEDFMRDHRSRDHYQISIETRYELVCKHCGYSYGVITEDEDFNVTPDCCEEAMKESGYMVVDYKEGIS